LTDGSFSLSEAIKKMQEQFNDNDVTQAEYYMRECFELAKKALGRTSPNPIVGAMVLDKKGFPVGKGYHRAAGTEHAEVIAIKEAGEKAKGGTLILNLEPCCHIGRTPPCTDLIIQSQIREVIFSCYDSNPLVSKKGEEILLKNNIQVFSGVLESEGIELNKFFFKWIKSKSPWITLKQAQTLDGKIALSNKQSKWITGDLARREVHNLRNIYDGILVGAKTVEIDNPALTVRDIDNSRNPARIIIDLDLITKPDSNVYKNNSVVYLATKTDHSKDKLNNYLKLNSNLQFIQFPEISKGKINFKHLFEELGKKDILSVLVEAGPILSGELISSGLLDEYILFIAPKIFGDSMALSSVQIKPLENIENSYEFRLFDYKIIGNDLMLSLRPKQ